MLFLDIALDSGRAWNRPSDVRSAIEAVDRLRVIVRSLVDDRLSPWR